MYNAPSQKGHRDRTSPERIARTTLEAQALRLRREGHAFDEIAEMLGITGRDPESKARYLVESSLERKGKQDANAIRADLIDRMDRVFNRAFRIARQNGPDRVAALNAATTAAARIAALAGSDAPKQVELKDDRQSAPVDSATAEGIVAQLAAEHRRRESEAGSGDGPGAAGGPPEVGA